MPSMLLGGPGSTTSGGICLVSGAQYSGSIVPVGGIQLRIDKNASGNVYIGFSGGITVASGGFRLSGGGNLDGVQFGAGDSYFIPRLGTGMSGFPSVYVSTDAVGSGQTRIYWELY